MVPRLEISVLAMVISNKSSVGFIWIFIEGWSAFFYHFYFCWEQELEAYVIFVEISADCSKGLSLYCNCSREVRVDKDFPVLDV